MALLAGYLPNRINDDVWRGHVEVREPEQASPALSLAQRFEVFQTFLVAPVRGHDDKHPQAVGGDRRGQRWSRRPLTVSAEPAPHAVLGDGAAIYFDGKGVAFISGRDGEHPVGDGCRVTVGRRREANADAGSPEMALTDPQMIVRQCVAGEFECNPYVTDVERVLEEDLGAVCRQAERPLLNPMCEGERVGSEAVDEVDGASGSVGIPNRERQASDEAVVVEEAQPALAGRCACGRELEALNLLTDEEAVFTNAFEDAHVPMCEPHRRRIAGAMESRTSLDLAGGHEMSMGEVRTETIGREE